MTTEQQDNELEPVEDKEGYPSPKGLPFWRFKTEEFERIGPDPSLFNRLRVKDDDPHEEVIEKLLFLVTQKSWATQLLDFLKQEIVRWCEKNGNLTFSEDRYWFAGVEKRTKCRDAGKVIERLLVLTGGDFDDVVGALSSNAIKPGYVKKLLTRETPDTAEEEFDALFEKVEVKKLSEKKPAANKGEKTKTLIEVDKRFVR